MFKKLISVILVAVVVLLTQTQSVLGIAQPDSTPQINEVTMFDTADDGVGVLVDYTIEYAVLPTETATESFMAVFVDADGSTQLKAVAPYTFVDSGYGRGVIWIKFTSSEVATYNITTADLANYRVWLVGNPTLSWTPSATPSQIIASVDDWITTGDPKVRLAQKVLSVADTLELAWTLDLVSQTSIGNKLTTTGEQYFSNVITNLLTLAPAAFSTSSISPTREPLDFSMRFGANVTGSVVTGSPVTLSSGTSTINITGAGSFVVSLLQGTIGNITSSVIASSPVVLTKGSNTFTTTGAGNATIYVTLNDTQTQIDATIDGTGMDTQAAADDFQFSRTWFSALFWLIFTVVVCGGLYAKNKENEGADRTTFMVFSFMLVAGAFLGMFPTQIIQLVVLVTGAVIGYVLFFRYQADIGRTVMFCTWMLIVTTVAGNLMQGELDFARTYLTSDLTITDDTITVASTAGFPDSGVIVITNSNGEERIAYAHKTDTTFTGSGILGATNPLVRGAQGTDAIAHSSGEHVSTVAGAIFNSGMSYDISVVADSSGGVAYVSVPIHVISILGSIIFLPLSFLKGDLAIIGWAYMVIGLGLLISITIAFSSGRRV